MTCSLPLCPLGLPPTGPQPPGLSPLEPPGIPYGTHTPSLLLDPAPPPGPKATKRVGRALPALPEVLSLQPAGTLTTPLLTLAPYSGPPVTLEHGSPARWRGSTLTVKPPVPQLPRYQVPLGPSWHPYGETKARERSSDFPETS